MKRSEIVVLAVIGSVYTYTLFQHDGIYRDQYRSREDCERDWGNDPRDCQSQGGSGGVRWWGPRYEEGARPRTRNPGLSEGRTQVLRGGFGPTGARYTRGGGG